jgi:hypothetical protein
MQIWPFGLPANGPIFRVDIQRMAVREDLMDVLTHEYGYFIHRHAEADYVQKSKVFRAKELGGELMNGDWKYNINTRYSAKAKIDAAKISKYATEYTGNSPKSLIL